jgi:hypothetical protein
LCGWTWITRARRIFPFDQQGAKRFRNARHFEGAAIHPILLSIFPQGRLAGRRYH